MGGGGGSVGGAGRFAPAPEGGQSDLGGVKELATFLLRNGTDDDSVGGAGDEVAEAVFAFEDGHGFAVCGARLFGSYEVACTKICVVGTLPGSTAAAKRSLGGGGFGGGDGALDAFLYEQRGP